MVRMREEGKQEEGASVSVPSSVALAARPQVAIRRAASAARRWAALVAAPRGRDAAVLRARDAREPGHHAPLLRRAEVEVAHVLVGDDDAAGGHVVDPRRMVASLKSTLPMSIHVLVSCLKLDYSKISLS